MILDIYPRIYTQSHTDNPTSPSFTQALCSAPPGPDLFYAIGWYWHHARYSSSDQPRRASDHLVAVLAPFARTLPLRVARVLTNPASLRIHQAIGEWAALLPSSPPDPCAFGGRILLVLIEALGGQLNHLHQDRPVPPRLSLYCWGHLAHTLLQTLATFFTSRRTAREHMLTFAPADNLFELLRDTLDRCVGTDPGHAHSLTLPRNPSAWLANHGWVATNPAYSQAMRSAMCTQVLYFSDDSLALGEQPSSDADANARWHDDWRTEHA